MPNNFPNFPLIDPGLETRIIDGSNSQTLDQLYFVGTTNNYLKKVGDREVQNYSSFGNFWTKQTSVQNQFRDILDGGDSSKGTAQFVGPVIGGEFPTKGSLLNQT
jgi:hypothetical protein